MSELAEPVERAARTLWEHVRLGYPGLPDWDRIVVNGEPIFGEAHAIGEVRGVIAQAQALAAAGLLVGN